METLYKDKLISLEPYCLNDGQWKNNPTKNPTEISGVFLLSEKYFNSFL